MFKLLDTVALTRDFPESGLRRGDLEAIVGLRGPEDFEVEFVASSGRTRPLLTLGSGDVGHVGDQDRIAVRSLTNIYRGLPGVTNGIPAFAVRAGVRVVRDGSPPGCRSGGAVAGSTAA